MISSSSDHGSSSSRVTAADRGLNAPPRLPVRSSSSKESPRNRGQSERRASYWPYSDPCAGTTEDEVMTRSTALQDRKWHRGSSLSSKEGSECQSRHSIVLPRRTKSPPRTANKVSTSNVTTNSNKGNNEPSSSSSHVLKGEFCAFGKQDSIQSNLVTVRGKKIIGILTKKGKSGTSAPKRKVSFEGDFTDLLGATNKKKGILKKKPRAPEKSQTRKTPERRVSLDDLLLSPRHNHNGEKKMTLSCYRNAPWNIDNTVNAKPPRRNFSTPHLTLYQQDEKTKDHGHYLTSFQQAEKTKDQRQAEAIISTVKMLSEKAVCTIKRTE
jgi:hypothetical protein